MCKTFLMESNAERMQVGTRTERYLSVYTLKATLYLSISVLLIKNTRPAKAGRVSESPILFDSGVPIKAR